MSRLGELSLRGKFRLAIMLTSLAALILTVGVLFAYVAATYRASQLHDLVGDSGVMAANTAAALAFDDPASALDTLSSLRADPAVTQAAVYTPDGRLLTSYAAPGRTPAPPRRPPDDGHRFADGRVSLTAPVLLHGERIGTLYLEQSLEGYYATLQLFTATAVLVLLAALAVAYLLSGRFQRAVSDPLLELVDAAKAVSKTQDYSRRVAARGTDEIGTLIDAFNGMLGQIAARDAALQDAREGLERRVSERTAELQTANSDLEAFNYSVSHDLRAPLRHIDSFSKLIEEQHAGALDDTAKSYLRRVRVAAQRMDRLIQGLLSLASVSRAPLNRRPVDLGALARDIAAELKERQPERRADFLIAPKAVVSADPALVRAALQNLLDNAWKFSSRQPEARIEFGLAERDGRTAYFVRDNGVGFDMAAAAHLFGAFQRLHPADEFPGTGIGLANVQRIIQRHGGALWAEAEEGKGAAFFFTMGPDPSDTT